MTTFDPRPWIRLADADLVDRLPYLADALEEAGDKRADMVRGSRIFWHGNLGAWVDWDGASVGLPVSHAAAVAELARRVRELLGWERCEPCAGLGVLYGGMDYDTYLASGQAGEPAVECGRCDGRGYVPLAPAAAKGE